MTDSTIRDALSAALDAYAALEVLGEEVEDEWTYVTDLEAAWRDHLTAVAERRGDEPIAPDVAAAIDRVIDEVERLSDPHRAIDWLSTFPQVVLVALGEPL